MSSPHTAGTVEVEVLITRNAFTGTILLVEGDRDSRFWRKHVDERVCRIVLCGGKPQLIGGIQRINAHGLRGVLGILDPDLAGLVGAPTILSNVYAPDAHDLESMLFHSPAFERVLAEYAEPQLIAKHERQSGQPIRDLIIDRATLFAKLRWWLNVTGSTVAFDRFRPTRFIDPTLWDVRQQDLLQEVANATGQTLSAIEMVLSACPSYPARMFCHGKDLVAITASGLQRALGRTQPGEERVSAHLRGSLQDAELRASELGRALLAWEVANAPFRIF